MKSCNKSLKLKMKEKTQKLKLRQNSNKIFYKTQQKNVTNHTSYNCDKTKKNPAYGRHSTDTDSSTYTTVGWTKNTQKPNSFEKHKKSLKTQKLKKV